MGKALIVAAVCAALGAMAAVMYTKGQHSYAYHTLLMTGRRMQAPQPEPGDIGIYSIFMSSYSALVPEFLENMRAHFVPDRAKRFYIVADDADLCLRLEKEPDVECAVKHDMEWPYPTLYRWNFFRKSFEPPESVSHIFFLNANARCVDTITEDILGPHVAVLHNMFWDAPYEKASFERNPISMAYVPPAAHVRYYGARFLGATRENFLRLCEVLDRNTQIDESNHFIAAWHDESHWNYYVNMVLDKEDVNVLGPEYHVPEELYAQKDTNKKDGAGVSQVPSKVIYLDKANHVPMFEETKSRVWQYTVSGDVKFGHPYLEMPAFQPYVYRALNPNVADLNDEALRQHYLAHPENPYFHESPAFAILFDAPAYMELYGFDSELAAKFHYIREGVWSEDHSFPVRGCAATGSSTSNNEAIFLSYPWQKGDRLEKQLRKRLLAGLSIYGGTPTPTPVPTKQPTQQPTTSPTSAPTALVATGDWAPLGTPNQVCAGGDVVPITQRLRRAKAEPGAGEPLTVGAGPGNDADGRALSSNTNPFVQACFETCQTYFAPNDAQFFFNVIQEPGGNKVCECCATCDTLMYASGGMALANCIPNEYFTLGRKVSSTRAKPGSRLAITVNLHGARGVALQGLALAIVFPQDYVSATGKTGEFPKAGIRMPVQANPSSVVWPQFDVSHGQTRYFKAKFRVGHSTPAGTELAFEVVAFQTAGANGPYCPRTVNPVKVKVMGGHRAALAEPAGTASASKPETKGVTTRHLSVLSPDPVCRLRIKTKAIPNAKRGPARATAGKNVVIIAAVKASRQTSNGVVELLLPAAFQVLKTASSLGRTSQASTINGQTIRWHNVTLDHKKPKRFAVKARVAACHPSSTVQALATAYEIDPATGSTSCPLGVVPVPVQVKAPHPLVATKLAKYSGSQNCTGAGGVTCFPGFFAPTPAGPCQPCMANTICPGGVQPNVLRCPYGTGTQGAQAFDPAQCVILSCDTCPVARPDLYMTDELQLYKQPAWEEGIPTTQESAQLLCAFDRNDFFLCAGNQATGNDRCILNDIAIDNQGNFIVVGRRASLTGTGWIVRVNPAQIVSGQPCPYTVLIPELTEPWSGLGGSRRSNLFYGISNTAVLTMQLQGDTATVISQATSSDISGGSDMVTADDGRLYAVVKDKAFNVAIDGSYIPVQGDIVEMASGGITFGGGAFCTPGQAYGISRANGQTFKFLDNGGTFTLVGGSGRASFGVTGAAVPPVCGAA